MHSFRYILISTLLMVPLSVAAQMFNDVNPGGSPYFHDGENVMPADLLSIGTGAAWMDANADGNPDLYVTLRTGNNLLFIGDGDGGFTESAVAFQVHDPAGDGAGVAIADFNNDGFQDIYLANSKSDRLLRNDGGITFTDITVSAGIDINNESRGTSASWADYNNDGYLDLYVANHVPMVGAINAGTSDQLYRNNGDETFSDVSQLLSSAGEISGNAFVGGWMDYDLDGDQDLFVINDCLYPNYIPNKVFRNDGNTHPTLAWNFTEVSSSIGVDSCANGMGLAMGDYNRDGFPDYYFSNIGPTILFEGNGSSFLDKSGMAGTNTQPWPMFSWGTAFLDADLDGWQDIFLTLGSHHFGSGTDPHHDMFFLSSGNGTTFVDRSGDFNLADSTRGRTAIAGDFDNDGDLDLALVAYGEDIVIKENDLVHTHHFLKVGLRGTTSNRDGIGARIRIKTPDGGVQWRFMHSGSSLGGGDQLIAHFGIGNNTLIDTITVYWPAGGTQVVTNVLSDQQITIKEYHPGSPGLQFSDVAMAVGIDAQCGSCGVGNGVSFADFNGDGLDDLSFGTQIGDSVLFYQNTGSGFMKLPALVDCVEKTETVLWFDSDNDGDKDLLLTNFQGQNRYYRNDGNLNLVELTTTCGLLMQPDPSYGAVAADYDKDGDLDFYIANWSFANTFTNYLYRNDGNHNFTDVTAVAGVGDGFNLTFCSAFFDYDNDGWPDLYNAQDRHYSKNSLFRNNGNGTFTDVSVASNSDLGIDAMNVGIGDYDNDDDMDIFVTNSPGASNIPIHDALLQNQGDGTFAEVSADVGVDKLEVTWGGNFLDLDLDKDLDLYVSAMHGISTSPSDVFVNQFPLDTFITVEPPGMEGDTMNSFSNAIGDLDNDGLPDIAVNNGNYFTTINKFQLWRNNSNVTGHWLKVKLHGVQSNRDAVGSKIEYFIDGQKYIRYTHCGIAYLAQNSFTEILGTGQQHTVDTLRVIWPSSGIVSTFYDIPSGQTMHIYETQVLYVNKDATGEDTGLSWQHAFTRLEDALAFAANSHIKEIWVKSGVYNPHATDREASFVLSDDVEIYGGFNGTETLRSQRDPFTNQVILSGDIGTPVLTSDNSYHVVYIGANVTGSRIDGVTIIAGRADGTGLEHQRGAGILCKGSLACQNIGITGCFATDIGAAIFASGWRADVQMDGLTLQANTSPVGRHIASSSLALITATGNNEIKN